MRVMITNQMAGNKGDRAVLYFLLRELVRHGVREITVSTSTPTQWARPISGIPRERVRFVPFGWNVRGTSEHRGVCQKILGRLGNVYYRTRAFPRVREAFVNGGAPDVAKRYCDRAFWEALETSDVVIATGGHRMTNLLVPDGVFPAIFDTTVVLLCGKPLWLWSQSVGPLEFSDRATNAFFRKLLCGVDGIYLRDSSSIPVVERFGVPPDRLFHTSDSVVGLYDVVEHVVTPSKRRAIVGISVYSVQKRTPEAAAHYYRSLAAVADRAAARGYVVRFFPMALEERDRPAIEAVIQRMRFKDQCSVVEGYPETPEHLREVAQCRAFIGHKTHSVVFALTTGTPVVGIAYHPKTLDFLGQFGVGEMGVADDQLSADALIDLFDRAVDDGDVLHDTIIGHLSERGPRVQDDFADLLRRAS